MHLRFQHQILLFFFFPENLNVMHFSCLADCPRRAVVWSSFRSEWLPKFHTHPLNHIFSGLELTSLISWKSAISDIISLSSWSAPRKAPAGRFRPQRLLQSEAKAPFTEQKHVCSCEYSSFLMVGCRKTVGLSRWKLKPVIRVLTLLYLESAKVLHTDKSISKTHRSTIKLTNNKMQPPIRDTRATL